ncbi:MAG: tetratricopeptide repeat protein [Chitinispirillales bacterium]|jgi:tetratricopeptide (TPR) repeat protein|nr:tetratricopeptide repeat protein [Chitinispirillales bacterium]
MIISRSRVIFAAVCVALAYAAAFGADDSAGEYIHYRLAVQYKNEKKTDLAIEEFRKVLAAYPDHYNSYMQLAEIYTKQGNYKLAIYNLQRALVYNPGWSKAQFMLAESFAADGQLDRAVREYQHCQTNSDPAVKDSLQHVINALLDRMKGVPPSSGRQGGQSAQTQSAAKGQASASQVTPVKLDPRAEEAMKKVISLYDQGKYDEMLVAVKEVLAMQPNHPGAYYYGGLGRMKKGELDKAKINFYKAISHPVYGGAAYYYLGVILGQEGNKSEAVKYLRSALNTRSTDFDRNDAARLIELYSGQKVPASMIEVQQPIQSVSAKPDSVDTAVNVVTPEKYAPIEIRIDSMLSMMTVDTLTDAGQKLLKAIRAFVAGRYDDALREFKSVLAENSGGPVAAQCLYNAGICYYRLRLYKDAENQFQLFLDRFPSHKFASRAVFFKACTYQERSDYAQSEKLFRKFIQDNRAHEWVGRAYERLGDSYADLEQHKKAIDAYTQALAGNTPTPTDRVIINYKLGNSCAVIGDNSRAINYFAAAIDIGEKNGVYMRVPDSYYKVADINFKQKDFSAALDYYKKVTRKYPAFQETPWGLFQIAGIQRNMKLYREAVDTYKDLMQRYPDDYWSKQAQWKLEDTVWEHEYRQGAAKAKQE